MERYKKNVSEIFDSEKNWSIMIAKEDNDTRNNIMRKVKFEQIKRKTLRNFMREAKKNVLNQRPQVANERDGLDNGM